MQFLKYTLATILGLILFSIVGFFIFLGIISAATAEEPVKVADNSVLHIKLNKPVTELQSEDPLAEFGVFSGANTIGLVQLRQAIKAAKEDPKIKGILLEAPIVVSGFASSEEIRSALIDFKESGKFLISNADYYTEGGYYLSSVSDKIYMHPQGFLELNGISSNVMFFKGLFDKLDIEAQIFRVGEYKSAVEPFMRDDMSEENREQIQSLLKSVMSHMTNSLAESRSIELSKLEGIIDQMEVRKAEDAVNLGLIDQLIYGDELRSILQNLLDLEEDQKPKIISYSNYSKTVSNYVKATDQIAVIVASGEIVDGGGSDMIDGRKFANLIRKAREDDNVDAIVLRINSPGGQLQASDLIWREVELAAKEKTMIASFGDYAASGGYYIGVAADTIVASPTTITGSIGIFGVLFNFGDMLDNKMGITTEEVNTGEYSGMYTVTRSLTEAEKVVIQNDVERGYETFVSKVAKGRNMSMDEVKSIAGGRVWSGDQGLENHLVDIEGGLGDAIEIAAEAAGIEDYKLYYYPKQKTILEELMQMGEESSSDIMIRHFGELAPIIKKAQHLLKYQGIQARTPWEIQFN